MYIVRASRLRELYSHLGETIEKLLATEVEFFVHQRCGSAEGIVEVVYGQRRIITGRFQDDSRAIASGDVDAPGGGDGRGENEIANAVKAQEITAKVTGSGLDSAEDILVVPDDVESVVVEKRGRD